MVFQERTNICVERLGGGENIRQSFICKIVINEVWVDGRD